MKLILLISLLCSATLSFSAPPSNLPLPGLYRHETPSYCSYLVAVDEVQGLITVTADECSEIGKTTMYKCARDEYGDFEKCYDNYYEKDVFLRPRNKKNFELWTHDLVLKYQRLEVTDLCQTEDPKS